MKVCCVYIQAYLDYNVNTNEAKGSSKGKLRTSIIPLGISYISSALKQNGYNTYGVLFVQGIPFERIICDIYKDTDIICISITSYSCWIYAKQILNKLKEYLPKAKIIVGGTFVTLAPENIFKNEKIDALCIGEGEKAIVEYVKNYQEKTLNKKIDNLYIRENGQIIKCDRSLFIEDIDKLPYPDRHIWDKWTYDRSQHKVLTERGCPNKCVYCANHKLANASQGTYLRHRNPIDIVNEIKSLKKDYPQTSSIMLYSENAASKLEHFIKKQLPQNISVKFTRFGFPFIGSDTYFTNFLAQSINKTLGTMPKIGTAGGNSDALSLHKLTNVVEIGTPIENAHIVNEYVSKTDLEKLYEIYFDILGSFSAYCAKHYSR